MSNLKLTLNVGDALDTKLPDQSVDLVLGSPPYTERRNYGTAGMQRKILEWIDFMLLATDEALRVSRGPVVWIVNGCMKKRRYQPAVEGLMFKWFERHGRLEHPLIWSKNAAPNRKDWWCNGWEYIVAFTHPDMRRTTFDWEAIATDQKFATGGHFRQRGTDGERHHGKEYDRNPKARPYDILRATVGGGHMGHPLAHENEAPYPESLVTPLILALTKEGDTVLDPFVGSGTTCAAALKAGRSAIGLDIRESQITLAMKRCEGIQLPLPAVTPPLPAATMEGGA